ncbi:hypothetical protein [Polaribacter sp. 11A2H]|uniref:hypothetical protein n=1 Tax=Polaribacter sp. 11A2H TaxID=2687290 RepID=UPI001409FD8D|nr:hypothetical protein [Polaribacter sp. 11A2H]
MSKQNTKNNQIITFQDKEITDKVYNQDKSKVLMLQYTSTKNPVITFKYQVVDVKTNKELKKGVFTGEKMEWLDNTTLKCTPHIGMVQKQSDEVLLESVPTKKKYIFIKID